MEHHIVVVALNCCGFDLKNEMSWEGYRTCFFTEFNNEEHYPYFKISFDNFQLMVTYSALRY